MKCCSLRPTKDQDFCDVNEMLHPRPIQDYWKAHSGLPLSVN